MNNKAKDETEVKNEVILNEIKAESNKFHVIAKYFGKGLFD